MISQNRHFGESCFSYVRWRAEIVGQAAGALPLSEGDKDKRIPDEAELVSRF